MNLAPLNQLEGILEELSLDECCHSISDQNIPLPNKVALVVTLAAKFRETEDLSQSQADAVLRALPDELVEELLDAVDPQMASYQQLMFSVLSTLMAVCSDDVVREKSRFIHLLLKYCEGKPSQIGNPELETITKFVRPCVELEAPLMVSLFERALTLFGAHMVKQKKELPSKVLLLNSHDYIRFIDVVQQSEPTSLPAWSKSYRTVISRILRTSPGRIADEYRKIAFTLIQDISELCGPRWFMADSTLLCLVSHLVCVQLRIVLDKPSEVNLDELSNCIAVAEMCIRCVDGDEEVIGDEQAQIVAKAVREACLFVMDYWAAAMDSEEKLTDEVQLQLYRLVCCFIAIGGVEMVPKDSVDKIVPHLYAMARLAIAQQDSRSAGQLICILELLPTLLKDSPQLLIEFVEFGGNHKESQGERVNEVVGIITAMASSSDWYDRDSLKSAVNWAQNFPDKRISEALRKV